MKEMLYEVRCLKSTEDMILALAVSLLVFSVNYVYTLEARDPHLSMKTNYIRHDFNGDLLLHDPILFLQVVKQAQLVKFPD